MPRLIEIANRFEKLNRVSAFIARWAILLMISLGFWNVIGRYLGVAIGLNLSSNALIEGQWYLFDLAFLLGLGWTLQNKNHVRVDILQGRWSNQKQIKIELLGTLFLLLPFALSVMLISIGPAFYSLSINEASPDPNGLPRYLIKCLIPIGFLLLSLQGFANAIKYWLKLKQAYFSKLKEGD